MQGFLYIACGGNKGSNDMQVMSHLLSYTNSKQLNKGVHGVSFYSFHVHRTKVYSSRAKDQVCGRAQLSTKQIVTG